MSSSRERSGYLRSKIQTRLWVFLETWRFSEDRPSQQFADGEWDKIGLQMKSAFYHQQNIWCSIVGGLDEARNRRRSWRTHFRNEPDNHRVLVNVTLACNQLFFLQ